MSPIFSFRTAAIACGLATILFAFSIGATPASVSTPLQFTTSDQILFPDQNDSKIIPIADIVDETLGPMTEGQIVNVDQDVPVEVLQAAWQQAIDQCTSTSYTYTTPARCTNVTVTPTQAQCESGQASGSATVTCCAFGSTNPPGCGTFDFGVSETVNYSVNVGVGIGPMPTEPAPRPFEVGAIVEYESTIQAGVELEVATNDGGAVNVDYHTTATLISDADSVLEGDIFTLSASHIPGALSSMSSQYPAMSAVLRYFVYLNNRLEIEYAHMNAVTGEQEYGSNVVIDMRTANLPPDYIDSDDRLIGELVSMRAGIADGFELRVLDEVPYAPEGLPGLAWQIPLTAPGATAGIDITNPFTCPILSTIDGVCGFPNPPLSTKVLGMSLRVPELNTPVSANFNGGVTDLLSLTPAPVLSNALDTDGALINTAPSKFRPALNFDPDGNVSWQDFIGDNTTLSGDYARFELDLDGVITLPLGPTAGATSPFTKSLSVNDGVVDYVSLEANSLDSDLIMWLGYDQELRFEPNLEVDIYFDKPVLVRTSAGDPWTQVSTWTLPVGSYAADAQLEVIQPSGGVTVTPVYTLRSNSFENRTTPVTSFGWQNRYLTLSAGGLILDVMAAAGVDFNLDFAAITSTLMFDPIEGDVLGGGPRPLENFVDVTGAALQIATAVDSDGDGISDDVESSLGLDPQNPDTDGDGLLDGFEVRNGFDALNPGEAMLDSDGDGLDNLGEQAVGTDPHNADTDGDGISDGAEVALGGNPTSVDGDADGVDDNTDNCVLAHNPGQTDVDTDGFGNACDADLDNDCTVGFSDLAYLKSVFLSNDPLADFDGDGSVNFGDLARLKSAFLNPPGPSAALNVCNSPFSAGMLVSLTTWLDAADSATLIEAAGGVQIWIDKSSADRTVSASDMNHRPLSNVSLQNGLAMLSFDGNDDVMCAAEPTWLGDELSVFVVARNAVRRNYNGILSLRDSTQAHALLELYWQAGTTDSGSGTLLYMADRSVEPAYLQVNDAQPAIGNAYVASIHVGAGADREVRVNLEQQAPIDNANGNDLLPGAAAPLCVGLGFGASAVGNILRGDIGEVIVFDRRLQAAEVAAVEDYLNNKWDIVAD